MKAAPDPIVALACALAAVVFGTVVACIAGPVPNHAAPRHVPGATKGSCAAGGSRDDALFEQTLATIERDYVGVPNRSQLVHDALQAMASRLDPYSRYLDSAELQEFEASAQGLDCAVRRKCVPVRTVTADLLAPHYGYVRISSFNDKTPAELRQSVAALNRMNHGRLRGLVLDLRDNGGGVFEDGTAVADAFLDSGVIVSTDGRAPDERLQIEATADDLLRGAPMAVLVNGDSASASEIVAAALRDHARATLVGTRTFGKGTIQSIIPLSRGALELTTARFFAPSGAPIEGSGIVPDVLITRPNGSPAADAAPSPHDAEARIALEVVKQSAHDPVEQRGDWPILGRHAHKRVAGDSFGPPRMAR